MKEYDLEVGFGRIDITPPLGVKLMGYFVERIADGVLDGLEINCIAFRQDSKIALLITADNCGIQLPYIELAKDAIVKALNIDKNGILIHSTHTHTSSMLSVENSGQGEKDILYSKYVIEKFAQVAKLAVDDLKSSKLGYAVSKAENIGFNRRYLMKDGSAQTNPGINNPNVVKSMGLLDQRVNVLRFERVDGSNIVLANYGNHPDTIGGNKISGDWPAITRRVFEKVIDNCKCIVFNGCQGDINHVKVQPSVGYMNGMKIDFDNVPRGYSHAVHMANVLVGAILQVYEKVNYVKDVDIDFVQKQIEIPHNKPTKEEMPEARQILEYHNTGRDEELPYKGMMLTTMVADATRKVRLENAPDTLKTLISIVKIGKIAIVGLPGEPFTGVGMGIKETNGYDLILPCCNTNAKEGYFPMKDSYDEGGYEAKTSPFKSGCAELLISKTKEFLGELL